MRTHVERPRIMPTTIIKVEQEKIDSGNFRLLELTQFDAAEDAPKTLSAGNPYIPPAEGCPINGLPTELLTYIFEIGAESDARKRAEDDEEDSDDDEDELELEMGSLNSEDESEDGEEEHRPDLEFQVLVSHVCRRWREVALQTPNLWVHLTFNEGPPFDKSKAWIERSQGCPLFIAINCAGDSDVEDFEDDDDDDEEEEEEAEDEQNFAHEGEAAAEGALSMTAATHRSSKLKGPPGPPFSPQDLATIQTLIMPEVGRWFVFELIVEDYLIMHHTLQSLAAAPPAPELRHLHLYHYEDCEDYDTFRHPTLAAPTVPFGGHAPRMTHCAFWGVHLDWGRCDFLAGLEELELAYHTKDVRPSYADFARMLVRSPNLETLTLCLSGPAGDPRDWPSERIELPSVRSLVLSFLEPAYAGALLERLVFPGLVDLALDFDQDDYSPLVAQMAAPLPGHARSMLRTLEGVKLSGLPCTQAAIETLYAAMPNVKMLNINCNHLDTAFFEKLIAGPSEHTQPSPSSAAAVAAATTSTAELPAQGGMFLPHLHTISTTGIPGSQMRKLIEARQAQRFKGVYMELEDDVKSEDENWLRKNVDHFAFFEGSEDEDEDVDVDVDMDEDEDGDGDEDGDMPPYDLAEEDEIFADWAGMS